jgi:hypothetical protein
MESARRLRREGVQEKVSTISTLDVRGAKRLLHSSAVLSPLDLPIGFEDEAGEKRTGDTKFSNGATPA